MNSAARKIQRGWRRTAVRIGRLAESENENIMKNIPLKRLHQILLHTARKQGQDWKYSINANGHMIYHAGPVPIRLNRKYVIADIVYLTNIRPNAYRNRAARVIQAHFRGARGRREAAFRSTPFGRALPGTALNRMFRT